MPSDIVAVSEIGTRLFEQQKDRRTMESDEELVRQARDGRVDKFAVLVERYESLARASALNVVRDIHAANDIVQDSFIAAFESIGEKLSRQGTEEGLLLLGRDGKTFTLQWELRTPDGEYWVMPIDVDQYEPMTLSDFVRRHAARFTSHESWRVPSELLDLKLERQDLAFRDGTSWKRWVQYVLGAYDLELVDRVERRTFWIARHDGRELKPWRQVAPPVPYVVEGGTEQIGVVRVGIGQHGHPVTIHELFEDFNRLQNLYLTADSPIIEDQTGLPRPPARDPGQHATAKEYEEKVKSTYYLAADSPWFAGGDRASESQAMAREWFKSQFGVTFEQEKRPMTIHVVRRRQPSP